MSDWTRLKAHEEWAVGWAYMPWENIGRHDYWWTPLQNGYGSYLYVDGQTCVGRHREGMVRGLSYVKRPLTEEERGMVVHHIVAEAAGA